MAEKPTYEELEQRIQELEQTESELKQAEEALRESEEKYRNIFENSVEGIFASTPAGRFISVNSAFAKMIGYESPEALVANISDIPKQYYADSEDRIRYMRLLQKDGYVKKIEFKVRHKDGTHIWVSNSTRAYFNEDGKVVRYEGIVTNISEHKQAVAALRESEKRLEQAIQGNSIPTFVIDKNHITTHWNKACENLTGFSATALVGTKNQWRCFYPAERPVLADLIVGGATEAEIDRYYGGTHRKSILLEGAYEGENFFPDMGEKGKWIFFTAAPLKNSEGTITGAIQTFQDITERRNTEAQLRQAQKMEAVGTLAGGVAHDFNNILTTIIGNAHLALLTQGMDDPLREEIEEIRKAGERAASLTRQLLAFSRKQITRTKILNFNKLITGIEKMLVRLIGEDIELLMIPGPELWQVEADPGQMEQIIMNLAVNARDAMPKGGKLTIETLNVDLDRNYLRKHGIKSGQSGSYVMAAVSDTGSGMDKNTQEHMFEPFFTTKKNGKGTGLGLSTVYGIVKQNKGFIWPYSEPGQGSTFKVYLPGLRGDIEAEEKEQAFAGDVGGTETVLIVEDDDSLRNFTCKTLQQQGYNVLEADNGEDALKACKEYKGAIQLVLTDVVMPKMGGREVVKWLQPRYPQMKVIYMSGYTDDAIVHHGVLKPGVNFLEKPFSPEVLARKVREVLDSE